MQLMKHRDSGAVDKRTVQEHARDYVIEFSVAFVIVALLLLVFHALEPHASLAGPVSGIQK